MPRRAVPARVMPKACSKNFAAFSGSGTMMAIWRRREAMDGLHFGFSQGVAHLNERCDICKPIGTHGTGAALHTPTHIDTAWPDAIFRHFRRLGIRQVGYVPDAGHSRLIALCQADPDIADVVLTTKEEGVGLVAGAALGGQRAALLMQSSGVGK